MCGSSQRKPLEAKVFNLALRSDESERFLDNVEQDLSPALCSLLLVVTTPRIYLIGSDTTGSIAPEKRCERVTYTEMKFHVERKKVFKCPVY